MTTIFPSLCRNQTGLKSLADLFVTLFHHGLCPKNAWRSLKKSNQKDVKQNVSARGESRGKGLELKK